MTCDVIVRGDLEAYVFGEAAPEVARRVEAHLFGCNECASEMRLLRGERRLFRSRLDGPAPAVPSFEALLARLESEPATVRPARWSSRAVTGVTALVAAAAAIGWLWLHRPEVANPHTVASSGETGAPEIVAEAVCESGETPADPEQVVWNPVSQEPTTSVDQSFTPRRSEAVARRGDDPSMCSPGACEACGNTDAPMTSACEDSVSWCAESRQ